MVTDLKKYAGGSEVELPGFIAEEPFVVMLRRPSLLGMVEAGKIPNPLLSTAASLFHHGVTEAISDDGEKMKNMAGVLTIVAKSALVSPTYDEIRAAGLELTDLQLMFIYDFVQTGVDTLKSFRAQQELEQDTKHSAHAEKSAE